MRLLVIDPGLKLWGSERALLATLSTLREHWSRIYLMTPCGSELASAAPSGIDSLHAPFAGLRAGRWLARLALALAIVWRCRQHRIDRIYLNQAGLCRIVRPTAWLLGIPLVIHARIAEDLPRCRDLKSSSRSPVTIVVISTDMLRRYEQQNSAPDQKAVLLAYDPFELHEPLPPVLGDRHGFACVGRLATIKGQRLLVDAVDRVRRRGAPLRLDFIGAAMPGDDYGRELEDTSHRLGLDAAVRFLGYRSDVERLLAGYRFVVIPSIYEPLGRVVVEGWKAGAIPICSAHSGGAAEIVQASGSGILYPGNDPEAIASALRQAASLLAPERAEMIEKGRRWARRRLSIERYVQSLAGVLFPKAPSVETRASAAPPS